MEQRTDGREGKGEGEDDGEKAWATANIFNAPPRSKLITRKRKGKSMVGPSAPGNP